MSVDTLPDWALWSAPTSAGPWSLGVEEEVMLLDPTSWTLAQAIEEVLPALSPGLAASVSAETHAAALELSTTVHRTPAEAVAELAALRSALASELDASGLRAGVSGTHPFATWQETRLSAGARYQLLHGTLRELARREPSFALHVHVGVPGAELAIEVANRMRAHLPLLLALSANSPYWQGRDTGLASARTSIFQAFPRVGLPRRFASYSEWTGAVGGLIDSGAIPEPTFLWWDVRLQPRFGTVEVRIMDAQTSLVDIGALVAFTQALVRLEALDPFAPEDLLDAPEALEENRFLAARDGMDAELIHPGLRRRVPARDLVREALAAARPHAADLGSLDDLEQIEWLADDPPAARQRALAGQPGELPGLVEALSEAFLDPPALAGAAGRAPATDCAD